jgi:hypothetical protein
VVPVDATVTIWLATLRSRVIVLPLTAKEPAFANVLQNIAAQMIRSFVKFLIVIFFIFFIFMKCKMS